MKATVVFPISRKCQNLFLPTCVCTCFPLYLGHPFWRLLNDSAITCLEKLSYYTLSKEAPPPRPWHTITLPCLISLKISLFKVWALDPQHWRHLGAYKKCRFSGPTRDLRVQNLHSVKNSLHHLYARYNLRSSFRAYITF